MHLKGRHMADTLKGRAALITGAGRRIGRAIALALAARGVNVAIHFNRSGDAARELAAQVERAGARAWTVQADFNRAEEYQSLIARTVELTGGFDILINNASIFPAEALSELAWPGFAATMEVNAWVPLTLSRGFARAVARGGIVNLHDTHLKGFDFKHAGYILSKHVLAELTRMMAIEFAPRITVNAVAPGLILPPPGQDDRYLLEHSRLLPLRKHGSVEDIAEAVLFLLQAKFITGQVIYVDGGRHLYRGGLDSHLGSEDARRGE
jgi:pteridine reductase